MNKDQVIDLLPQFITGSLGPEEALAVSRALANAPELMADLRLALRLHDTFQAELTAPPPFPQALYQEAGQRPHSLIPSSLRGSIKTLRQARGITSSAIKMALNFIGN
ncbi:MAG: hypothetical protein GXZ04_06120 [Clostridiales bacterium]|nr:hypothetical protein [Clostridiales bacterium]